MSAPSVLYCKSRLRNLITVYEFSRAYDVLVHNNFRISTAVFHNPNLQRLIGQGESINRALERLPLVAICLWCFSLILPEPCLPSPKPLWVQDIRSPLSISVMYTTELARPLLTAQLPFMRKESSREGEPSMT